MFCVMWVMDIRNSKWVAADGSAGRSWQRRSDRANIRDMHELVCHVRGQTTILNMAKLS